MNAPNGPLLKNTVNFDVYSLYRMGQLIKTGWGARSWLKISAANLVTSILFVCLHMIHNPPILLHAAFNALVIESLFIHGNMVKLPL